MSHDPVTLQTPSNYSFASHYRILFVGSVVLTFWFVESGIEQVAREEGKPVHVTVAQVSTVVFSGPQVIVIAGPKIVVISSSVIGFIWRK